MPLNARLEKHPYYERIGLDPAATGLDTRIAVAVRAYVALAPRLTVVTQDGKRLVVSLSATPQILAAPDRYTFRQASWEKVVKYIRLNLATLLVYWYEMIDAHTLVRRLHRLETQGQRPAHDALC